MSTRADLQLQLEYLRKKTDAETLVRFRGVHMSRASAKEFQEQFCQGCGRDKKNPKPYFGELFCGDCVEKWSNGKR